MAATKWLLSSKIDMPHSPKNNKSRKPLSKARLAALEVVQCVEKDGAFARKTLDKILRTNQLSNEDRRFATKLSLGVAQTKLTLDELIFDCVDSADDIKPNVLNPLRISTYEIIYLEKEPHAAVDQGVELVGVIEPRARGLANFVLHKIVRHKEKFPFGNPDDDIDAFCRVYSVPRWIYDLLVEDMGIDDARILISSCNGQPPCYIFVNEVCASVDEVIELLEELGAEPKHIPALCGVNLTGCVRVGRPTKLRNPAALDAMHDGKFIITDAASQAVCEYAMLSYVGNEAPGSILQVCAGSGNKAIMLGSLVHARCGRFAKMTTLDNVEFKTNQLLDRCKKCGVPVEHAITGDACDDTVLSDSLFDHVFVDAPCSGLGTLRRHPELKWRLSNKVVNQLTELSFAIMCESAKHVTHGGFLTLSTCTVTQAENEGVVKRFLDSEIGQNFVLCRFAYNGQTHDFYNSKTIGALNDVHFAAQFKKIQ